MDLQNQVLEIDQFEEEQDSMEGIYLTFNLVNQSYGLEIRYVIEIIRMQKITEVPDATDSFEGLINLRGKIIPVMDMRMRFQMKKRDYGERTCIIVVSIDGLDTGLIVDSMRDVLEIPESKIQPPPSSGKEQNQLFISGLGKIKKDIYILLDVEKVILITGSEAPTNRAI
jgi:purine-binding chemotaxis protein CheW